MTIQRWIMRTVIIAALAFAPAGCEKQQQNPGSSGSGGSNGQQQQNSGSENDDATAGFDAVHDLVVELIRRRHFDAAEVGIDHLEDMAQQAEDTRSQQIDSLRAAIAAARGVPAPERTNDQTQE